MSARTIFCRFCGASGAHRFGKDRCRRQRYKCPHCAKVFTGRTNTAKSYSHLTDSEWKRAEESFCIRGGMSGVDLARTLQLNEKTGQRMNRIFRAVVTPLRPSVLPGVSEWDESVPVKRQWVAGGVSRDSGQCVLSLVSDRSENTLTPFVERHSDPEGMVCTDEHGGYIGVANRWTVCHAREFVNSQARFVHTNTIEGVWGQLKPLGWHIYRGFPRSSLPSFLAEFSFRYNLRSYETRLSVLSALLNRKTNSFLV